MQAGNQLSELINAFNQKVKRKNPITGLEEEVFLEYITFQVRSDPAQLRAKGAPFEAFTEIRIYRTDVYKTPGAGSDASGNALKQLSSNPIQLSTLPNFK